MELITKTIREELEKYPYGSQDGKGLDAKVIVKFFNPCGAGTWLITELAEETDDDIVLYGYCEIGYEWEWGCVSLKELEDIILPFGMKIERDMYSHGTVRELMT